MLKKCSLVALLAVSASAFAATATYNPGPYVGAQVGIGAADDGNFFQKNVEALSNDIPGSAETHEGGGAGRIFVGYNFVKYFSIEAGYMLLGNNTYEYKNSTYNLHLNYKISTYAIDLVGKFMLPLGDSNWNLYAKLGGAYVNGKITADARMPDPIGIGTDTRSYNAICPAYGLGVAYNFNENVSMDLSWFGTYSNSHFNTGDKNIDSKKPVPTTNAIMFGVAYKFTQI